MQRSMCVGLFMTITLGAVADAVHSQVVAMAPGGNPDYVPGEVIIAFQPGTPREIAEQIITDVLGDPQFGGGLIDDFQTPDDPNPSLTNLYAIATPWNLTVEQTIALLLTHPEVVGADPNYFEYLTQNLPTPNDPDYPRQWGLNNTGLNLNGAAGSSGPAVGCIDADIDAPQAWVHNTDCSREVVAVIDSGIDITHPDFAGNLWVNPGEVANDGIDNDANGVIDDVNGANFEWRVRHTEFVPVNGTYEAGEDVYQDITGLGSVTVGDRRLAAVTAGPGYAANTIVAVGDADIGRQLVRFVDGPAPRVYERYVDADGTFTFTPGDSIYRDVPPYHSLTAADGAAVLGPAAAMNSFLRSLRWDITTNNVMDTAGHGTAVAGVIGARGNNNLNIAGVCWRVQLMALRLEGMTHDAFLRAMNYLLTKKGHGVNVRLANYSAGGPNRSEAVRQGIGNAGALGVLLICASGNGHLVNGAWDGIGYDLDAAGADGMYPARFNTADIAGFFNIISVGSVDNRDRRAGHSNWGTVSVDVFAPGLSIRTLRPVAAGGGALYINGTSFATPHVTGILAQGWAQFPNHTARQMRERLISGLHGPVNVQHPDGVDPRPGLTNLVRNGPNHDGRARMFMGDDFGDAADPAYRTLLARNGARHEDSGEEWLGRTADLPDAYMAPGPLGRSNVSPEYDAAAIQNGPADPDGAVNLINHDGHDDGIEIVGPLMFSPAGGAVVKATVWVFVATQNNQMADIDNNSRYGGTHPANQATQGVHAVADNKFIWVNGFFDWNGNGHWDDANEHVFTLRADPSTWGALRGGAYKIEFDMPQMPANVMNVQKFARFRLDYGENLGQGLLAPPNAIGPSNGGLVQPYPPPVANPAKNLYESLPINHAQRLFRSTGLAQFGEVEDYVIVPVEHDGTCQHQCPGGAFPEAEVCGVPVNDGCNGAPQTFGLIACNSTVCGTLWAENGHADTDWYVLSTPAALRGGDGGLAEISLTLASSFPSTLHLVNANCADSASLAEIGSVQCQPAAISLCVPAGQSFYLVVSPGTAGGVITDGVPCNQPIGYSLSVQCTNVCSIPQSPVNDDCAERIDIADGSTAFSTVGASTDGPPQPDCQAAGDADIHSDVWFNYAATCTGVVTVSTCGAADFDSKIAVYEGCTCPAQADALIACNDDSAECTDFTSLLRFNALAGECYAIRVGGYMNEVGSGTLTVSCNACRPDINGDHVVNVDDLVLVIMSWGSTGAPGVHYADVNGSGVVDIDDLVEVITNWGACP